MEPEILPTPFIPRSTRNSTACSPYAEEPTRHVNFSLLLLTQRISLPLFFLLWRKNNNIIKVLTWLDQRDINVSTYVSWSVEWVKKGSLHQASVTHSSLLEASCCRRQHEHCMSGLSKIIYFYLCPKMLECTLWFTNLHTTIKYMKVYVIFYLFFIEIM